MFELYDIMFIIFTEVFIAIIIVELFKAYVDLNSLKTIMKLIENLSVRLVKIENSLIFPLDVPEISKSEND